MGRGAGRGGREAWGDKGSMASTKVTNMTALSALSAMSTTQASGARMATAASILASKPGSHHTESGFALARRTLITASDQSAERALERSQRSIALARKMQMISGGCHCLSSSRVL
jgi:hypothetical protein